MAIWPEKQDEYSHVNPSFWGSDELEKYHDLLLNTLHLDYGSANMWTEKLESGCDEPLELLLMALSPRLRKITFVQYNASQYESFLLPHEGI